MSMQAVLMVRILEACSSKTWISWSLLTQPIIAAVQVASKELQNQAVVIKVVVSKTSSLKTAGQNTMQQGN